MGGLYFQGPGDPRDLHSFPTRRSSDLAVARRTVEPACHGGNPHRLVAIDAVAQHEDRKSTRLNSSHVRISYAVFCLKKKKTSSRSHPSYDETRPRSNPIMSVARTNGRP